MRPWIPLLALSLAAPALAQEGAIEVQPLEPLTAPGITQNNDGGGIVVRPVEPLTAPDEDGSAASAPDSESDLLGEGFNDDAFGGDEPAPDQSLFGQDGTEAEGTEAEGTEAEGTTPDESLFGRGGTVREGEGSFIDRAFRQPPEPDESAEGPDAATLPPGEDPAAEGTAEDARASLFGSDNGLGDEQEDATGLAEEDDKPRFIPAPFTTRGLYGPNRPSALPRIPTVPVEGAELRQLDKMTGATRTVTMEAGQERELGRLRVRLEACHAPQDGGTRGTVAFLRIWDPQRNERAPVFSGWMFADSPALSALDHPRYDLWVLDCTPMQAAGTESPEEPGEG